MRSGAVRNRVRAGGRGARSARTRGRAHAHGSGGGSSSSSIPLAGSSPPPPLGKVTRSLPWSLASTEKCGLAAGGAGGCSCPRLTPRQPGLARGRRKPSLPLSFHARPAAADPPHGRAGAAPAPRVPRRQVPVGRRGSGGQGPGHCPQPLPGGCVGLR